MFTILNKEICYVIQTQLIILHCNQDCWLKLHVLG